MLLWYGTFLVAGLLVHGALRNADSVVLSAALLAGAVALPLTMLGYTIRSNGGDFNSHVLVPAIGPIVIAVLIFDYVEYNRRIDEAFSAQLISADLVRTIRCQVDRRRRRQERASERPGFESLPASTNRPEPGGEVVRRQ